jgi:hypothetical protein
MGRHGFRYKLILLKLPRKTLGEAKSICELNESAKGDRRDTARVLRMLADALEMKGMVEEARRHKLEAEGIRRAVQKERFAELPDCEESYNLMVFHGFR